MHIPADLFLRLYYYQYEKHESPASCGLAIVVSRIRLLKTGDEGEVLQWCLQTSPRQQHSHARMSSERAS